MISPLPPGVGAGFHTDSLTTYFQTVTFSQANADVCIVCRDGRRLWAHRSVLSHCSRLMETLLAGDRCCLCTGKKCAKNMTGPKTVIIDEYSDVMALVLKVIYTGEGHGLVDLNRAAWKIFKVLGVKMSNISVRPSTAPQPQPIAAAAESSTAALPVLSRELADMAATATNKELRRSGRSAGTRTSPRGGLETRVQAENTTTPTPLSNNTTEQRGVKRPAAADTSPGGGGAKRKPVEVLGLQLEMAKILKDKVSTVCQVAGCSEIITIKTLSMHFRNHYQELSKCPVETPLTTRTLTSQDLEELRSDSSSSETEEEEEEEGEGDDDGGVDNEDVDNRGVDNGDEEAEDEEEEDEEDEEEDEEDEEDVDDPAPTRKSTRASAKQQLASTQGGKQPTRGRRTRYRSTTTTSTEEEGEEEESEAEEDQDNDEDNEDNDGGDEDGGGDVGGVGGVGAGQHLPDAGGRRKLPCQICTRGFRTLSKLKTHYTLDHFWDRLKELVGDSERRWCGICLLLYPTPDHLVQHMANFHNYVDKILTEKKMQILNQEKTIRLLDTTCKICDEKYASSSNLKSHLSVRHFSRELSAEFPIKTTNKIKNCPKCFKQIDHVRNVISHVGSFHDEVLKYALKFVSMEAEDEEAIPVDDFDDSVQGIPYVPSEEEGAKCRQCGSVEKSATDLKLHYCTHFKDKIEEEFSNRKCKECDSEFGSELLLYRHIVENHGSWLENVMQEEGHISLIQSNNSNSEPENLYRCFTMPSCQICYSPLENPLQSQLHYYKHYKATVRRRASSTSSPECQYCGGRYSGEGELLSHILLRHLYAVLVKIMEENGLWTYPIPAQPGNAFPTHNCRVQLLPSDRIHSHRLEKLFTIEPPIVEEPKQAQVQVCPLRECGKELSTRRELLLHLLHTHYFDTLRKDCEEEYRKNKKICPVCLKIISFCGDLKTYLEHVALEHEKVMKYVQEALGERAGPRFTTPQSPSESKLDTDGENSTVTSVVKSIDSSISSIDSSISSIHSSIRSIDSSIKLTARVSGVNDIISSESSEDDQ